ncbi:MULTISPECIES: ABC transporter ATP-binding protein [Marinovum]|jgi:iron(III) transport system ATP-binding protein|uniref:Iron(III) transport system ATP-binding protein n=1 Tax=Marinovum algicola TaxID=42444 RepID=A0A975WDB1_9RHOB|nr:MULTISPECIES: ABC transporter ATP-binding protein [Marinovum]MDD9745944.1 ABC transporter ATP-binding protein [Marinovum sp. PR37]SEJ99850.1 iron(III) transport system ATP-binding protein [Marinovum algicola]SLN73369.1 Spermidine/putrescine import ATP-binding protein PotA [Marinovum algicola]
MSDSKIGSKAAPVRFEGVSKLFGKDVVAVDRIDLDVAAGKLVTLLGPSGCGKTTTLRMIAGLEMASAGRILIGGRDVTRLPATDRDVSMVFQSYALFPHMNVLENVMYGLTFSGFARDEARSRALHGLDLVGLRGFDGRLPSELSGGQQQRVAVARALVLEPQVLLFDEPLSNLDAKLRRQVREDIRAIQQDLGLTVVYVTHDQEEALAVSDEIVVMRNAAIAQIGTPRQLFEAPNDRFVADFIGEANLLACTIVAIDGQTATIDIEGYRHDLPSRGLSEGPATIAVRPSRLRIGDDRGIRATVAKATYVGVRMEYTLTGAFGQVFAVHEDVDAPLAPGAEVRMGFAAKGPVLLHE